jgi:AraC family transcriptional regulator, positive regulator of tynA and feaB
MQAHFLTDLATYRASVARPELASAIIASPGALGALTVNEIAWNECAAPRTLPAASADSRLGYVFLLIGDGRITLTQFGRTCTLGSGDIALCDAAAPHSCVVDEDARLVLVHVPEAEIKAHLPSPGRYCSRQMAGDTGLAAAAGAVIHGVCTQLRAGLPVTIRERVARHLLETISIGYASAFDHGGIELTVVGARREMAHRHIEQHLRDPDLSPASIARDLKISARYLRLIFSSGSEHESISAYILRRRLEQCARQMIDPLWRGRTISEIAFAWGFNSAPHFSRRFREQHGESPRQFRLRHQREHGSQPSHLLAAQR